MRKATRAGNVLEELR